jgi:hypothetical protein
VAIACVALPACTGARGVNAPQGDAGAVDAVAQRLDAAIFERDAAMLRRIVSPGFVQVLGDGTRADRERFIEQLTAPGPTPDHAVSPREIRMLGDAAVVTFTLDYPVHDGTPGEVLRAHAVDVYHRQGGKWRLEFEQLTVRRHGR